MARRKKSKRNMEYVAGTVLLLALAFYFLLRDSMSWVSLIMPEFLGLTILFLLFRYTQLKNKLSFKDSLLIFGGFTLISFIGFVYGRTHNIRFLVDLSPEILGYTSLGFVLTLIFKRRTVID